MGEKNFWSLHRNNSQSLRYLTVGEKTTSLLYPSYKPEEGNLVQKRIDRFLGGGIRGGEAENPENAESCRKGLDRGERAALLVRNLKKENRSSLGLGSGHSGKKKMTRRRSSLYMPPELGKECLAAPRRSAVSGAETAGGDFDVVACLLMKRKTEKKSATALQPCRSGEKKTPTVHEVLSREG